ncbi:glycosyltransferase [Mycobacterium camsae]|uniref:glycosyltransferase n=1 Tax=Mycobacterium gordonae TaxID=1778 RepID=UPI0019807C5C|nr:glycosyltransferase [Mycobacterium gordonae]
MIMSPPEPRFDHLSRLTDRRGAVHRACLAVPCTQHGYRTDDMARMLVVASREADSGGAVNGLARVAMQFLNDAQSYAGPCRNRMDSKGRWEDEPSVGDAWGHCIWGLGTAAAHSDVGLIRRLAVIQFERAAKVRAPRPRSMAFAALGAAELLSVDPGHRPARELLTDYAAAAAAPKRNAAWPWPEPRLTFANAVIPEAIIAAAVTFGDSTLLNQGLDLLGWLLGHETAGGHLSPTPAAGRGPADLRPAFDQRPIEVSTLADACARACAVDKGSIWRDGILAAAAWFSGANDAQQLMWDPETGGGFDALLADGVDQNQGAEATLAVLSTMQHTRRLSIVRQ